MTEICACRSYSQTQIPERPLEKIRGAVFFVTPGPIYVMSRPSVAPFACKRSEFSLPDETHYLNCAYMSPLSRYVESAGISGVLRKRYPGDITPDEFFATPNRLRDRVARLTNVKDSTRVAIVPSVSYAMAIAVNNLTVRKGQNIVVVGEEFPSAVLPWRKLSRERDVVLRTVTAPCPEDCVTGGRGALWNNLIIDAIDHDTAVVVLSHVHWSDGTRFDLARIAERARELGSAVCIDATQSLGALPLDVSAIKPDLLVAAGYKWLMGGYGLAVAYLSPRFDNGTPLEEVWTNQTCSDDFTSLATYKDSYREDMSRYDGGERANFVVTEMLCASIDQLLEWGVANIQQYCEALVSPWLQHADGMGLEVEVPEYRASHLFGLRSRLPFNMNRVTESLKSNKVQVSIRGEAIRVSPHVYNNEADMESLFLSLAESGFCRSL